jgi:anti-sigma-K factor RskA
MNLHPELLDRLAAAYALGTLRGGARRRFESLARQSPAMRAAASLWQQRFAAMLELQPAQVPSENVWKRIEHLLALERPTAPATPQPGGWTRALAWWRGAALVGALATVLALVATVYLLGEVNQPRAQYVAVLADDRNAASMLVTFDPKHSTLTVQRVGGFREPSDKSLQLWALPAAGGPRSLGVLGANPVIKLAAGESQLRGAPALAISLEPKGGVPGEGGPTGPVLFKGALLKTS